MRRRSLVAVITAAICVLALMPGAALAEGAPGGQQGVQTQSNGTLELESERSWCATAASCTGGVTNVPMRYVYAGPAQAWDAFAGAYSFSNNTHGTPDELVGECQHFWTDAMGVYHLDQAYVDTYAYPYTGSNSGLLWLMNSGAESNTAAMATVDAAGTGSGGFVQIQGYGSFNNGYDPITGNYDVPNTGTNFRVTIIGSIYHYTAAPNGNNDWVYASSSFGATTCQTQAEPTNSFFRLPQNQPYVYGEAETND